MSWVATASPTSPPHRPTVSPPHRLTDSTAWRPPAPSAFLDEPIQHRHVSGVKFARIRFQSREEEGRAFHGMIQHGRIISLRDDEFIVPAPALDWLKNQNFTPTILAW